MITALNIIILTALLISASLPSYAQESEVFLRDDFNSLENWIPLIFPKIKKHTAYSAVQEGGDSCLKAESDASASGIVFKREFSVFQYPKIRWRWKISNVFTKGNAKIKTGDDYPLRVYILFKYDPETASFGKRLKYGITKSLYGEYPPHSSLSYIWANRVHEETVLVNKYADESMMIPLESGAENAGMWIEEDVNIIEDYRTSFGEDPPPVARLAIMNDSDNTGESAVSYIDYIEVYR